MAAVTTPLVDQWSPPLMDDGELFGHLGLHVAKQDVSYVSRDFREHAVLAELNEQRKRQRSSDIRGGNVLRLQAVARGWIARKRYHAHKTQLARLLHDLKLSRETEAVTAAQKMVRGCLARKDLKMRQEAEDRRREELEAKKKKKAGKGKLPTGGKSMEDMTRTERLVLQEESFLLGWDMFIDGIEVPAMRCQREGGLKKVEDAVKIWEKASKSNPRDGVLTKMIDYGNRIRDQERQREAQDREREKAVTKAVPVKGGKAGAKQAQRPSLPSSAASEQKTNAPPIPGKRTSLEASYNKQQASAGLAQQNLPPVSQP